MSIWDRLRMIGIFIGLVKDPMRTELIFKAVRIASKYKEDPMAKKIFARVMEQSEFRRRYDERYLPAWPTMEQLEAAPEGSFAKAFHKHMVDNGLDLDLFPRFEPRDQLDYLNARAYQDHDLWHALLGYGTALEDELALQAFGVAQFGAPLGSLIISGGILHLMMRDPVRAAGAVRKISEGYAKGERARFLLGMKLIDLLPRPLEEVRRLAGVA